MGCLFVLIERGFATLLGLACMFMYMSIFYLFLKYILGNAAYTCKDFIKSNLVFKCVCMQVFVCCGVCVAIIG